MKRDAARTPTRSRKKPAVGASSAPAALTLGKTVSGAATLSGPGKNVGQLEGSVSVVAGVLFLVAALFPRTIKQLLMLGIGGGLVYRGVTGHCGVYSALDIDTAKTSLLKQINDKYLAPALDE